VDSTVLVSANIPLLRTSPRIRTEKRIQIYNNKNKNKIANSPSLRPSPEKNINNSKSKKAKLDSTADDQEVQPSTSKLQCRG
jgi:hypothetical protein